MLLNARRADSADAPPLSRSTTLGPLLSCALHFFTWDLASGHPVSAVGCGSLKTYDVCVVLGSLYVACTPQHGHDDEHDSGFARRPSWRKDPRQ